MGANILVLTHSFQVTETHLKVRVFAYVILWCSILKWVLVSWHNEMVPVSSDHQSDMHHEHVHCTCWKTDKKSDVVLGKMWIFIQMLLGFFSQVQIKHVSKAAKIIITKSVSHCPSLKHQQNNSWTYQKIHTGVSSDKAMGNLPILVVLLSSKVNFHHPQFVHSLL